MSGYGSVTGIVDTRNSSSLTVFPHSSDMCPMGRFVHLRLIDYGDVLKENCCSLVGRRVLQAGSGTMGTLGTLPFIPISLKLAGSNTPYGIVLSAGNVGSFSALNSWSLFKIIESEMTTLTPEELEMAATENRSSCPKITMKIGSYVVGALCQVPLSYMAYVYNNNNLAYAIFMMFSDSGVPIYSLLMTSDEIEMRRSLNDVEKQLHKTKAALIEQLQDNEQALIEFNAQDRGKYIRELLAIGNQQDIPKDQLVQQFTGKLLRPLREKPKEGCLRTVGRYLSKGGSLVLAGTRLALNGILGYKAMNLLTDDEGACYFSGAVIATASTYLTIKAMTRTAQRTYDATVNLLSGSVKPNLALVLNAKLTAGLALLGLAFTALSYGPSIQICRDTFSGKTETNMEGLVTAGTILMIVNAMNDLINDVVISYSGKWGDEEAKLLVDFHHKMQGFVRAIQRSPIMEHAKFLKLLPPDCLELCLAKAETDLNTLDGYISRRLPLLTD